MCIIFSEFVYIENIDRDAMLFHEHVPVVTGSGRTVIRPLMLVYNVDWLCVRPTIYYYI